MEDFSDVVEDAKRYELQILEKNKTMFLELSALEILLNDVYETHRPSSQDYDDRRNLIRIFNEIAREIYGNGEIYPVVKEFGSYVMELFNARCDLDLSINFPDNKDNADRLVQIKTLRKFAKKLFKLQRSRHVTDVQLILSARVPVLKVTDCGTRVECDLSVGNLDGIVKSQIILMISAIDERFPKLCILMKVWAKANDINSAKDGTINSISLILLVAFHLQTRDIPILPPFSAILKDGLDLEAVNKNIQDLLNYGERNKESLAELFVSMLNKLEAVNPLWLNGLCASTYEGSWISKKLGCVSIEDFADRSQNSCRALKREGKNKIFSCIRDSIKHILLFTEQKIDPVELKNLLFQEKPKAKSQVVVKPKKRKLSFLEKRMRQAEGHLARSEENSGNTKTIFPGNIKDPAPCYIDQVGASNATSTSNGENSGNPKKRCPVNTKAPTPSNVGRVGPSNAISTSHGENSEHPEKTCPVNIKDPAVSNIGEVGPSNATSASHGENSENPKKTCPGNIKNSAPSNIGQVGTSNATSTSHIENSFNPKKTCPRNIKDPALSNIAQVGSSNATSTSHIENSGNPKKTCPENIKDTAPSNIGQVGSSNATSTSHIENSGNPKKTCPGNIKDLAPSNIGQVGTSNATSTSHGENSGNLKKRCPGNTKAPTPSNVDRVGPSNATSTSHEENSENPKKRCLGNTNAPTPSNVARVGPSNATSTSHGENSGNPEKRCPGNIKAPTPSNVDRVGPSNATSTSHEGIVNSQENLIGARQQLLATNTFQGVGVVRPEYQQIPMSNPPVVGHGGIQQQQHYPNASRAPANSGVRGGHEGIRPNNTQGWAYRHAAPSFMPGHPLSGSNLPFQGSTGYGHHVSPHFPAGQGFGGYRPERTHLDHFRGAPNFQAPGSYSFGSRPSSLMSPHHPHLPAGQGFTGYRPERTHVDHLRGAPNFSDPGSYSFGSRPSSLMSPHQPHFPSAPTPYVPDLFPLAPSQSAQSSHALDNRGISGHQPNWPHGNRPPLPYPAPSQSAQSSHAPENRGIPGHQANWPRGNRPPLPYPAPSQSAQSSHAPDNRGHQPNWPHGNRPPLPYPAPSQSAQSSHAPDNRGIPGHQPNWPHGNQPPLPYPGF